MKKPRAGEPSFRMIIDHLIHMHPLNSIISRSQTEADSGTKIQCHVSRYYALGDFLGRAYSVGRKR